MGHKLVEDYSMNNKKLSFFCTVFNWPKDALASKETLIQTDTSEKYTVSFQNICRYFLKQIPDYASEPKRLQDVNELIITLKENNVPVVSPLIYQDECYVKYEGKIWQAFSYQEGNTFPNTRQAKRNTYHFLAQFHSGSKVHFCTKVPNYSSMKTPLIFTQILEDMYHPKEIQSALDVLINEVEKFCHKAKNDSLLLDLEYIWIHGDFSPNNIIYNNDQPILLLDFDNAHINTRVHDIAELYLTSSVFSYKENSTNFSCQIPTIENMKDISEPLILYGSELQLAERKVFPTFVKLVYAELIFLGFIRGDFEISKMNIDQALKTFQQI